MHAYCMGVTPPISIFAPGMERRTAAIAGNANDVCLAELGLPHVSAIHFAELELP